MHSAWAYRSLYFDDTCAASGVCIVHPLGKSLEVAIELDGVNFNLASEEFLEVWTNYPDLEETLDMVKARKQIGTDGPFALISYAASESSTREYLECFQVGQLAVCAIVRKRPPL